MLRKYCIGTRVDSLRSSRTITLVPVNMETEALLLQKGGNCNLKLPKEESLKLKLFVVRSVKPSSVWQIKRYSSWSGLNFNRLHPYNPCALYIVRTKNFCGCCVGSQCFQVRTVGRTGSYSRLLSGLPTVQLKKRTASDLNLLWPRTKNNRRSRTQLVKGGS
jgi:hypothetical protein